MKSVFKNHSLMVVTVVSQVLVTDFFGSVRTIELMNITQTETIINSSHNTRKQYVCLRMKHFYSIDNFFVTYRYSMKKMEGQYRQPLKPHEHLFKVKTV